MRAILSFLSYHNAVPIAVAAVLLLGAGTALAANPTALFSADAQVITPDNTYLANKDLDAYSPAVEILGVTEDDEYYFVAYRFSTIDIEDYVWRDVTRDETLRVSKAALGEHRDLGLYTAEQLQQKIARELQRLRQSQELARESISHKVVATTYNGLVGKFLDSRTETLPGYVPVVEELADESVGAGDAAAYAQASAPAVPSREEIERLIEQRVRELLTKKDTDTSPPASYKTEEDEAGGGQEIPGEPEAGEQKGPVPQAPGQEAPASEEPSAETPQAPSTPTDA